MTRSEWVTRSEWYEMLGRSTVEKIARSLLKWKVRTREREGMVMGRTEMVM